MATSVFIEKTMYLCILQLHIVLNGRKEACGLGCGLRSGLEESSIDLDNLVSTNPVLREGSKFLLFELRMSPFLTSRNFLPASEKIGLSKYPTLGKGRSWGNRHFIIEYYSF